MNTGCFLAAMMAAIPGLADSSQAVGQRPYELVWAHRDRDDHPPLVDFEDMTGWHVACEHAQATLERTRAADLGAYVARLTYRGTGASPSVRVQPPRPVPITKPFDAVTLWIYGNNWGWAPDPKTPQVSVSAYFADAAGKPFHVLLGQVDWKEWSLLHRRLEPEQIKRVRRCELSRHRDQRRVETATTGRSIWTTWPSSPRRSSRSPSSRGPNAELPLPAGVITGANTGPGQLPFPTRQQTILPDNLTADFKTTVKAEGNVFMFTYYGSDGTLVYRLEPKAGTWSDLSVRWGEHSGGEIRPCADGGACASTKSGPNLPAKAEQLSSRIVGESVESRWRLTAGETSADVTYTYRLWNKSLVIDTSAPGGEVAEVRFGKALGLKSPRLVTNPFYPAARRQGGRGGHGNRGAASLSHGQRRLVSLERVDSLGRERAETGRRGLSRRHAVHPQDRRRPQRLLRSVLPNRLTAVRGSLADDPQPGLALEVDYRHASLARARRRRTASTMRSSGPTAIAGE